MARKTKTQLRKEKALAIVEKMPRDIAPVDEYALQMKRVRILADLMISREWSGKVDQIRYYAELWGESVSMVEHFAKMARGLLDAELVRPGGMTQRFQENMNYLSMIAMEFAQKTFNDPDASVRDKKYAIDCYRNQLQFEAALAANVRPGDVNDARGLTTGQVIEQIKTILKKLEPDMQGEVIDVQLLPENTDETPSETPSG